MRNGPPDTLPMPEEEAEAEAPPESAAGWQGTKGTTSEASSLWHKLYMTPVSTGTGTDGGECSEEQKNSEGVHAEL